MKQLLLKNKGLITSFKVGIVSLVLLMFVMLCWISYYNVPSLADDYCFSITARDFGFWKAQSMYYNGWSGRYAANLYFHLNPLILTDNFWPFRIYPIVYSVLFGIAIFHLFDFLGVKKEHNIYLTLGVYAAYYLRVPSLGENIFWFSGSYTFMASIVSLVLLRFYLKALETGKYVYQFWSVVFCFTAVGFSEIAMVFITVVVGYLTVKQLLLRKPISRFSMAMILTTIVGVILVFTAPGNDERGHVNHELSTILMTNLHHSVFILKRFFLGPEIWVLSFWFYIFLSQKTATKIQSHFQLNLAEYLLLLIGGMFILLIPVSYGMGTDFPPRIMNIIYVYFTMTVLLFVIYLRSTFEMNWLIRNPMYSIIIAMVLSVAMIYKNSNLRHIYSDLKHGHAREFMLENKARINLIKSQQDLVHEFSPIESNPILTSTGAKLSDDPTYLWNKCFAEYYDKKEIKELK